MFGTLGFSELIIILVIVLIIFGAGRLPQLGEGVGKALKGFKKAVHEEPPPLDPNASLTDQPAPAPAASPVEEAQVVASAQQTSAPKPTAPYVPGPELTPGTTASLMATAALQVAKRPAPTAPAPSQAAAGVPPPPTMDERLSQPAQAPRAQYPPLPPSARTAPGAKRPSAVVNKEAVARVQAQQAAMRAKTDKGAQGSLSPQDMQSLGEGLGDTLRTFRQAVADVRNSVDPEMRTIQAEIDAAQKEIEQSIELAKQPAVPTESIQKT